MVKRHAFSRVEVVVALSLVALVAVLVVPRLGGPTRDDDARARAAIAAVADLQITAYARDGKFTPPADVTAFTGALTVTDAPSTSPETVAVTLSATRTAPVAGLAAAGTDGCWYLKVTVAQNGAWATGPPPCDAAVALALPAADPTLGGTPDKPLRL